MENTYNTTTFENPEPLLHFDNHTEPSPVTDMESKHVYWILLSIRNQRLNIEPSCKSKWAASHQIEQDEWTNIFKLPFQSCRSTKLQTFQYRILHRIITCNHWLYNAKIKDTPECSNCKNDDTIEHFFLLCPYIAPFWKRFKKWWNRTAGIKLRLETLTENEILFGFQSQNKYGITFNHVLLLAKKYIHDTKMSDGNICFYTFLGILKQQISYEMEIDFRTVKAQVSESKFALLFDQL